MDGDPWMPKPMDSSPYVTVTFAVEMLVTEITMRGGQMTFIIEYKAVGSPWKTEFDDDDVPKVKKSNLSGHISYFCAQEVFLMKGLFEQSDNRTCHFQNAIFIF